MDHLLLQLVGLLIRMLKKKLGNAFKNYRKLSISMILWIAAKASHPDHSGGLEQAASRPDGGECHGRWPRDRSRLAAQPGGAIPRRGSLRHVAWDTRLKRRDQQCPGLRLWSTQTRMFGRLVVRFQTAQKCR
jgi:hypothetical protein